MQQFLVTHKHHEGSENLPVKIKKSHEFYLQLYMPGPKTCAMD